MRKDKFKESVSGVSSGELFDGVKDSFKEFLNDLNVFSSDEVKFVGNKIFFSNLKLLSDKVLLDVFVVLG